MARVTLIEGRNAYPLARLFNWLSRRMLGQEATPLKALAHNPRFLVAYLGMMPFAQGKTRLPSAVRALAMHLVAEINGCNWCIDFGLAQASRQGVTPEKMAAVGSYATSSLFTPAERAALAYAAEATQVGARVAERTFAELRRHFSDREIVELAVAVAMENFYNRLNAPLEIESQGFCALPVRPASARRRSA